MFVAEDVCRYDIAADPWCDHGADVNEMDSRGFSALRSAALGNEKDFCQLLISKGAKPDIFAAAFVGDANTVSELLTKDPSQVDGNGCARTPLYLAIQCGSTTVVKVLVKAGADPCVKSSRCYTQTPLHLAASLGNKKIIELLLPVTSDINIKDNSGRSPMDLAMSSKHPDVAKLLKAHGGRCYRPHIKPKSANK